MPALDDLTPLAAVRTEEGRGLVETLLEDFEDSEERRPAYEPKFDFDRLRQKLGLAPRKQ